MASSIDICNLALAHLSDEATVSAIDPSDGSAQADYCVRFYPIARDVLLEMHPWRFNTKRIALAEIDTDELPDSWGYAYALPNPCLCVWDIFAPGATGDDDGQPFVQETLQNGTPVIFTDVEEAVARYGVLITDTSKFSALFVNSFSWLLASYLAMPITKNPDVKKACYQSFLAEFGIATAKDANAQKFNSYGARHTPGHISVR